MKEAGLYNRHPSSAPLLKAFTNFLTCTLGVTRYKQETMFSYLKHVRRFVNFQIDNTNLFSTDLSMHNACNNFIKATDALQKRLSKEISWEVVKKRYDSLTHTMKTPEECRKLLSTAKGTFLTALDAAKKDEIDDHVKFEIVHYLEALLVLKYLQRPGVVQNMKSLNKYRIHHRYASGNIQISLTVIGVAEHKTTTQQVQHSKCVRRVCETFTVSQYTDSERHLFAKYLAHTNATAERNYREKTLDDICHAYLLVQAAVMSQAAPQGSVEAPTAFEKPPTQSFKSGRNPVENQQEVHSDEPCTSRLRRCTEAFEMKAASDEPCTSSGTKWDPEDHQQEVQLERINCICLFFIELKNHARPIQEAEDGEKQTKRRMHLKKYRNLSPVHWLYLSDRWRKTRNTMQRNYVAEHFQNREHNEAQIKRFLQMMQWNVNLPRIPEIQKKMASLC
ncbi:hypothetical protein XELAEV_18002983mg [Xenopus laevis]|nr:hypothetical protein XELAEV_18002983mg [Xenopus laevis]